MVDLYSEEELIIGCRQGQRRFQEILYRRYAKKMYGICYSYAGERELAQDILQESFVKVFRNLDSFKEAGSLEGWIRRVVVNTAIDLFRQKKNINKMLEDQSYDTQKFTENEALPKLGINELMSFVKRLPEGARLIFNLFALEGYTHKEIAEQLSISVGTSKSQYNRARNLLQEWLGELNV